MSHSRKKIPLRLLQVNDTKFHPCTVGLALNYQRQKIAEFANSIDLDEVAHNEPPHLDLHCLPLIFEFSILYSSDLTFFQNMQTKILSSVFW